MIVSEPSYEEAIAAGISDDSYPTVRYGRIPSYSGSAIVTAKDGRRWRAVGHRSSGTAGLLRYIGWIEFSLCEEEDRGSSRDPRGMA